MHTSSGLTGPHSAPGEARVDIGNILVANIHPRKQGDPSLGHCDGPHAEVTGGPDLDFDLVPASPALEISGLVKRYGSHAVVDGIDLVALPGQVTAVLGPNGAGKTTTIECCEGLRQPDSGTVRVLGLDPTT